MSKSKTGGHSNLKMVNPNAAAIDIGSTMHMPAVNPSSCEMPVRAFTQDLHALADWFTDCGVTSVAMEYWRRHYNDDRPHSAIGYNVPSALHFSGDVTGPSS